MQHNWRLLFICMLTLGITACSGLPAQPPATTTPPPAQVESPVQPDIELDALAVTRWWLDYHRNMNSTSPSTLGAEYKSASTAWSSDNSLHNRLRLITLLSLSEASFYDPDRALRLLNEITNEQSAQPKLIQDTAALVKSNVLIELQDQKKIQTLAAKIKELQNNNTAIQQQLDALKEIERSIYERRKVEVTNTQ